MSDHACLLNGLCQTDSLRVKASVRQCLSNWTKQKTVFDSSFSVFFVCGCSEDEDDERHSTDPDSRDPKNSKKTLCKIKWSRDEVLCACISILILILSHIIVIFIY